MQAQGLCGKRGMSDTGDLQEGLDLCAVITGGSCYLSPQEVNREYHALFGCHSKGQEYLLEIINNYLLIAVSRKPSHFPLCSSVRARKCKGHHFYCLYVFSLKRNMYFFFITHFIFCYFSSFIYYCRWKRHVYAQAYGLSWDVAQKRQCNNFLRCRHGLFPQGNPWKSLWGTSASLMGWCKWVPVLFFLLYWRIMCIHRSIINKIIAGVQWGNTASTIN